MYKIGEEESAGRVDADDVNGSLGQTDSDKSDRESSQESNKTCLVWRQWR